MFKIGCIGFGGGTALVPVIESEVVYEKKLIDKEEYTKDVIVANITPGAFRWRWQQELAGRSAECRGCCSPHF